MPGFRPLRVLLPLAACLAVALPVYAQPALWASSADALTSEQASFLRAIQAESGTAAVEIVQVEAAALRVGGAVRLPLPGGGVATVEALAVQRPRSGTASWSGRGVGVPGRNRPSAPSQAALLLTERGLTGAV